MEPREGLSIANLVFYIPCLFIAAWVSFRHGFSRQSGWIFIFLLSIIRIVGSICQIVSVSSPGESIDEAWIILSSVGLSPLLLAMLGMLVRVYVIPHRLPNAFSNTVKVIQACHPPRLYNPTYSGS